MFNPTTYPELNSVLTEFVKRLEALLEDQLLAVYVTGSFALGAGDKDSDVDFLVLIDEDIADDMLPKLEALHLSLFDIPSYWSHHMEGSYLPKKLIDETAPFTPLVYIDNGHKYMERSTHDNNLVVRWVTREHGITLYGTQPKTYIDPIPTDALKAEVKGVMHDWGNEILTGSYVIDNEWAQAFAVIMYCRMLHTLDTGTVQSKIAAVEWGQRNLAAVWQPLIQEAWQKRDDQFKKGILPTNEEDVAQTIKFIRYVLNLSHNYDI